MAMVGSSVVSYATGDSCDIHMWVWTTDRIQTWCYLLGRTGTREVCVVFVFVILVDSIYQTCIWMLTLYLVLFCRCWTLGMRGREVARWESARQEPAEPRVGQRHRRDDVGVGPAREPQGDVAATLEDLCRWFEWVLQGVPEGIWAHI
jgi:hypothetical protein